MIEIEDTLFNKAEVPSTIKILEHREYHHEDPINEIDLQIYNINFGFKVDFYNKVVTNENDREPVYNGTQPP